MKQLKLMPIITSMFIIVMCVPPAETGTSSKKDKQKLNNLTFYDFWGYPDPVLSYKDKRGLSFKDCEKYEW